MVRHKTVKNLITGEIFYDTLHAKAESKVRMIAAAVLKNELVHYIKFLERGLLYGSFFHN